MLSVLTVWRLFVVILVFVGGPVVVVVDVGIAGLRDFVNVGGGVLVFIFRVFIGFIVLIVIFGKQTFPIFPSPSPYPSSSYLLPPSPPQPYP